MKRFIKDMRRYLPYTKYATKSGLKSEVASSHLSWLWWILDPILFMLVYWFIFMVIFGQKKEYFHIFVFVGLSMWNLFNKTVSGSVRIVAANRAVVTKVYIPKYMLILQKVMVNGFKMMVSFGLIVIMMAIYRVPITVNVLYIIPILIVLTLFTFGVSCFMLHFGVFIDDLHNVMQVVLRLMFYMTGIFYSIGDRLEDPYRTILLKCNPVSNLIESARLCLLYSSVPYRKLMLFWGVVSVVICILGIRIIYKYENSYVKVM